MRDRLHDSLKSKEVSDSQTEEALTTFYLAMGWDEAAQGVIGATSTVAAATWPQIVDITVDSVSKYLTKDGVDSREAVRELVWKWHKEVGHVHGDDLPINGVNLPVLVSNLKSFGLKVCICTSDSRPSTMIALKKWKILDSLDHILTSDDVPEGKPSPKPLHMLCDKFDVSPSQCIVVGDTIGDTKMGYAAKAGLTVGVCSGSGTSEELLDTGANLILPDVSYLPKMLKMLVDDLNDDRSLSSGNKRMRTVSAICD